MKKLIIINGTMGAGKTTTCKSLYKHFDKSVWLDGDWCWMMNPWDFNEENKQMVQKNILFLLKGFFDNSNFEYVFFSWVIHRNDIMEWLLGELKDYNLQIYKFSLVCSAKELESRMLKDGRSLDGIKESIDRIQLYDALDTIKIDTGNKNVDDVIDEIKKLMSVR